MAVYKCKMCGGDLEVEQGVTVVECEYCGTKQTVPNSNDEEIRNLFNRADLLRRKCEFDKAEDLYEKILIKDEKQAEAYWRVLLCKYGIEYVEDPKTFKRVPTCHRASFESITSDEYYKLALKNADPVQRKIYVEEAKYIDGVQKEILALSQKEEPYDVFICYKETDENGKRTEDSVVANDIYYQLTQEGYKVFYAAITLEDKLGSAYEPVIFAALHSSKVMLAIGTKPEFFNAVWVKNEWSRFLKLMKEDKTKQLIPCYRGMDAYELPEEFSHLQAQDMGKIGFINDLVRGIKKVIVKQEEKKAGHVSAASSAEIAPLLKRAYLFLGDGDFQGANSYAERVLDKDPEFAEAYLIKFCSELEVRSRDALGGIDPANFAGGNFKNLMRFADPALKAEMEGYISAAKEGALRAEEDRKKREQEEIARKKEERYQQLCSIVDSCKESALERKSVQELEKMRDDLKNAAKGFDSLKNFNYKDSAIRAAECRRKVSLVEAEYRKKQEWNNKNNLYNGFCSKLRSENIDDLLHAAAGFESLGDFKDSKEKVGACKEKVERLRLARKEAIYNEACKGLLTGSIEFVTKAQGDFQMLGDYKDSPQKLAECTEKIIELEKSALAEKKAQKAAAAKRKKMKIALIITAVILVVAIIITTVIVTTVNDKKARAGLTYELSSDRSYYIVSGIEDITMENIVIPETYHGRPVTKVDHGAFKDSIAKSITIPKTIEEIKCDAFSSCSNLQNVYFADSEGWWYCRSSTSSVAIESDEFSNSATVAKELLGLAESILTRSSVLKKY